MKAALLTSLPAPSTRAIYGRAVFSYLHQRRFPVYCSRPALIGDLFFFPPQYPFFDFLRTELFFCTSNIEFSCPADHRRTATAFK
jgi:hypothetical protein